MRGLVGVALLVGCSSGAPGALIEVTGVAAKRYELVYSLARCEQCATQMAPPSRSFHPIGNAVGWLTDDSERFPIEFTEARDVAKFQLQTTGSDDQVIERAVIVALAGDGPNEREEVLGVATIGKFTVPANDGVKFEVTLAPADAAFDQLTQKEHVEFWRRDLTRPACVLVQHATNAEYFGPSADPDCDDGKLGANFECTEYGYLSYAQPMLPATSCLNKDTEFHCRFGGMPCLEAPQAGIPPDIDRCMAVAPSYCLPQQMCNIMCPNVFDDVCWGNSSVGLPMVSCEVFTASGATCPLARSRMSLFELVSDTPTHGCKSIEVATIQSPLTFGTRVAISDGGSSAMFTIDPLTFDAPTCSIDISWSGTFGYTSTALIKVVTDSGVNRVVPWRLIVKGTSCPGTPSFNCTAAHGPLTDTLYTCQ